MTEDTDNPELRKLLDHVRDLERRVVRAESELSRLTSPFGRILMVKRGGAEGSESELSAVQWKEQTVVNGSITEYVDGRQCQADDDPAILLNPAGTEMVLEIPDAEGYRYVALSSFIYVRVEQDGGTDGSATTAATYTYTVTSLDATVTFAEGESPIKGRPNGKMTVGNRGVGIWTENGFELWDVNEVPGTAQCS